VGNSLKVLDHLRFPSSAEEEAGKKGTWETNVGGANKKAPSGNFEVLARESLAIGKRGTDDETCRENERNCPTYRLIIWGRQLWVGSKKDCRRGKQRVP